MTTDRILTCDTLDELLPEYLEHELDAPARAAAEAHLAACPRCSALVHDLTAISTNARALPELHPSRDLWDGIAARLEAPVVSLPDARREREERRARAVRRPWLRLGAAAAGLMAMTAGATYLITARHLDRQPVGAPTTVATAPMPNATRTPPTPDSTALHSSGSQRLAEGSSSATPAPRAGSAAASEPGVRTVAQRRDPRRTYDMEIARLQTIVADKRTDLDSTTIAVLEKNLRIIDHAITESRAALARDPASRFLEQQLNTALDRKLELLRTVALLPARSI